MSQQTPPPLPRAPMWRRLAALGYDLVLLAAILFFAFIPVALIMEGDKPQGFHPISTLYLLTISFLFFGWFWTHGGQTLGMRAWRLRLQRLDGAPINWSIALMRFVVAVVPFGLGLLPALFDKERHALHDTLSKSELVVLEKEEKTK